MHICLVTSGRPSEISYGGETRFVVSLRNWLIGNGYEVTIVERRLFGSGVINSEDSVHVSGGNLEAISGRTLNLPAPVYSICMLFASFLMALRIVAVNTRSPISVIHAQDTGYGGLAGVMAAKMLQLPVIITSHGIRYASLRAALAGISARLLLPFEYALDVFSCKSASVIVTVSSSDRRFFLNFGAEESRLRTIPVAVDTSRFILPSKGTFGMDRMQRNQITVGFVGRMSPEKNIFTLIRAFEEALEHEGKLKLILVGAGPQETELRAFTGQRGMEDKIVFLGARDDVEQILSTVDVFTLPSYVEGCPISLLEAMASGKAIVASDIPNIREIVTDGKEALLVNPYLVEEWGVAILRFSRNENLRNEVGDKARQKSRLYDIEALYPKIVRLYDDLLTERLGT